MSAEKSAFINLAEVKRRTTNSRATIYRRVDDGTFPPPIKLGPNRVAWLEHEIDEWIAARVAESRSTGDAEWASGQ